ncbi:MAG: hypothetical protein SR1Q5_02520 [Quinella sp. 1Q5]|nr:hypothetical protein [Quinella sp. 1Q5]
MPLLFAIFNLPTHPSADIYAGSVFINFNDGGLLMVDGTTDVTYQLADGSRYSANHSRRELSSK